MSEHRQDERNVSLWSAFDIVPTKVVLYKSEAGERDDGCVLYEWLLSSSCDAAEALQKCSIQQVYATTKSWDTGVYYL